MTISLALFLALASATGAAPAKSCDNPDITTTAVNAALDDEGGLYNLGVEFYSGRCLEQSYENAAIVWQKAANLGSVGAKSNLAYLVSNGLGVPEDESKAALLWAEAAALGHSEAQLHLGSALFYGLGVAQDRERGFAWVLLSVDTAMTVPNTPDGGGGEKVLKMAQARKEIMLSEAPDLLPAATEIAKTLLHDADER